MRIFLGLVTMTVMAAMAVRSATANEQKSDLHVRERFKRALAVDDSNVRRKRSTLEVPKGTNWEVRWGLNLPFEVVGHRYSAKVQVNLPIHLDFPSFLFEEYGIAKLKGFEVLEYPYDRNELYDYDYYLYDESQKRSTRSIHHSKAAQKERIYLYKHVESIFEKLGLPGRTCLLRTVCEVAQSPVSNGFMGDFLNVFLTPSLASPREHHSDDYSELVAAEDHGHQGKACHDRFADCQESMFELLPMAAKAFFSKSI